MKARYCPQAVEPGVCHWFHNLAVVVGDDGKILFVGLWLGGKWLTPDN